MFLKIVKNKTAAASEITRRYKMHYIGIYDFVVLFKCIVIIKLQLVDLEFPTMHYKK